MLLNERISHATLKIDASFAHICIPLHGPWLEPIELAEQKFSACSAGSVRD
jgi:hypothetical protein